MAWNYRAVQHEDYCGLHEVYYDDSGKIISWTDALEVGNNFDDLLGTLAMMLEDAKRSPVLTETDLRVD